MGSAGQWGRTRVDTGKMSRLHKGSNILLRLRSFSVTREGGQMEQRVKDESMWCFRGPGLGWVWASKKWIPFDRNKE